MKNMRFLCSTLYIVYLQRQSHFLAHIKTTLKSKIEILCVVFLSVTRETDDWE
jgi:hypothetical protein